MVTRGLECPVALFLFLGCSNSVSETNELVEFEDTRLMMERVESFETARDAGFYEGPILADVSNDSTNDVVRCTRDGSVPTAESYSFKTDVVIVENTVLRCGTFKGDKLTGPVSTRSFFVGEIVDLPVVSISVDPEFFKKYYYDIPGNCAAPCKSAGFWKDVELPAHVEFFEKGSKSETRSFEFDAGISIAGNNSRTFPKKSVALKIKKKYQPQWLEYPLFDLFPDKQRFKTLLLRNFGNRYRYDFVSNGAFAYMLNGTGVDFQRTRPVVVFYNGVYYGIHELSEKLNEHYMNTNYGIRDNVTIVKYTTSGMTSDQNMDEYKKLTDFLDTAKFYGSRNQNYEYVKSQLDVNNLAMYVAFEVYGRNMDWPNNNIRVWKSPHTKWKYIAYDLDFAFGFEQESAGYSFEEKNSMFKWIQKKQQKGRFSNIYCRLIRNPDFKRLFINGSAILFNSYVNSKRLSSLVNRFMGEIPEAEMNRDMARFVRDHKLPKNGDHVKKWAKARDVSIWEEYVEEFGLQGVIKVSIKSEGRGYITMDGFSLPDSPGYTDYTGSFFGGNKMLLLAEPEPGSKFLGWKDGNKDNPRYVKPSDGDAFVAVFGDEP